MTTKTDTELYTEALILGHVCTCIAIEECNGLYGYPPQLVSIGLRAIEEGRDPHEAIDAFIEDAEDEMVKGDD